MLTDVIILDNSLFCEVASTDWGFLLIYYFVFFSKLFDLVILNDSLVFLEGYISEKLIPIVFTSEALYRYIINMRSSSV